MVMGPILLVVDNYDFRLMTRALLESAGYKVISVGTGMEALDVLAKHEVSLIITDLYMSGMTGYGLLRRMRQLKMNVPRVIVVTGYQFLSSGEARVAAQALRAKVTLTKPIDNNELLQAVAYVLTDEGTESDGENSQEREA